jgi:low affinity Fe/Cu permease
LLKKLPITDLPCLYCSTFILKLAGTGIPTYTEKLFMKQDPSSEKLSITERFASAVTKAVGSSAAFIIAFVIVIAWGISGPIFHYSENWQLVINTGTTIITFLIVFLIHKSQNKDSLAIQLKLNELVAAHEFASNRLVNVENISEADLKVIQKYYSQLSKITGKEESLRQSHSIDEAKELTDIKKEREESIKENVRNNPPAGQ